MESRGFSIYEHKVKKMSRRALIIIFIFQIPLCSLWAETNRLFIILKENKAFVDTSAFILKIGGEVHLQVPPRIMTASIPESANPAQWSDVEEVFGGLVPIGKVKSLGALAVSAAQDWNRNLTSKSQQAGRMAFRSAKQDLAQLFLEQPENLQAIPEGNNIDVQWTSVFGSALYQIQLSENPDFSSIRAQTYSENPRVRLAAWAASGPALYLRVRAIEKIKKDTESEDVPGPWAQIELRMGLPPAPADNGEAPQLTSPVDNFETDGFSAVLEWISLGNAQRIQISNTNDFKNTLVDEVVYSKEYKTPDGILQLGKTYFWRARDWPPLTASPWSPSRRFIVTEPRQIEGDMMVNPEAPR